MRQLFLLSISFLLTLPSYSQEAKRYLLIEHFTNSRCGICSSRNPAFYNTIDPHLADIHHISYHPSFPYSSCVFYQHNTEENQDRAVLYSVPGTPQAYLWGTKVSGGSTLLSSNTLNNSLNQTSPLDIIVTEELSGAGREVSVTVKSVGVPPTGGEYRIFVALAEKLVNYDAPNGEKEHHDVFRKMLPSKDGESIALPDQGNELNLTYTYDFHSDWDITQIYAIAFVQDMSTKEIFNSGSTLDAREADTTSTAIDQELNSRFLLYPNPAESTVQANWKGFSGNQATIHVFSPAGQEVLTQQVSGQAGSAQIDVSDLPSGMYFLRLDLDNKHAIRKLSIE